jgi:Fur family ferric uptake transcriptional regulator
MKLRINLNYMDKEKKLFVHFLKEHGLKLTRERTAILKKAFACRGHFDPESLYLEIKQEGLKASRASVYRTINLLCECGLVGKVMQTGHGALYEITLGHSHHDHMLCIECGQIIEFFSGDLERLQEEVSTKQGFQGVSHSLEIRGYCRKCQKKKKP